MARLVGRAWDEHRGCGAGHTANGGLLFREPRPVDEAALVELLGRVEFTRPETGGGDGSCRAVPASA